MKSGSYKNWDFTPSLMRQKKVELSAKIESILVNMQLFPSVVFANKRIIELTFNCKCQKPPIFHGEGSAKRNQQSPGASKNGYMTWEMEGNSPVFIALHDFMT